MSETQPGILAAPPAVGRYLFFSIVPGADIVAPLRAVTDAINGDSAVLGLGPSLALALGHPVEGLVVAPHYAGAAVQQWLLDFAAFGKMSPDEQDAMMGRRKSDNEELADAPLSAHVKRTNQESFEPKAFVLRRSMPWTEGVRAGLMFVAFGKSFAAFDVQLKRMVGADDGIVDALFKFTRSMSGVYFWCPPMQAGRIDLRAVCITD